MNLSLSPEQKRRRILALGVIVIAFILSFFQRFAPVGIAPDLAQAFQASAASLGVLAATYFYVYTVMQIPTGILADTLGPRRVLVAGAIIGGIGSFIFGLAPNLETALIGRTLIGLGVSVTFISMLKIIAVWFEENRFASVTGICFFLGNMGSMLAGTPLATAAQTTGWRLVFIVIGVISLLLAIACAILVRDTPNGTGNTPPRRFDRAVILGGVWQVVRNRATWPAAWANLGMAGAFFTFGGLWAMPYLTAIHGLSRNEAATHLTLLFFGFALGGLILGYLSDRIGKRRPVLIPAAMINGLIWLIWISGIHLPAGTTYLLIFIMGITTASFTLTWACAKEVNPPMLSGISTSVTNMGGFLAAAILQPLVGAVMDMHWDGSTLNGIRQYNLGDFQAGFSLICLSAWSGILSTLRIRETGCRNIWKG